MNTKTYRPAQKLLHWAVFALVITVYGITYAEALYPRGDPGRDFVWWLHISFGLLLLSFVVLRVFVRSSAGAPPPPNSVGRFQERVASITHFLLYILLLAVPLIGVALTWYRGDALTFFGLFTIPSPVAADRDTAHFIKGIHELAANGLLILAGFHAAAALWHHFVRRDEVLERMLPGSAATSSGAG